MGKTKEIKARIWIIVGLGIVMIFLIMTSVVDCICMIPFVQPFCETTFKITIDYVTATILTIVIAPLLIRALYKLLKKLV